jgi:D-alanine--poly(phosphoribitol) ligase subunit 2
MHDIAMKVRSFIEAKVYEIAIEHHRPASGFDDDLNLIETGLFDSLAFVHLILAIEKQFDMELDIGDLGPEEFTTVGHLVRAAALCIANSPRP